MSNTPETDAEVNSYVSTDIYHVVRSKFAKKLERERNKAKDNVRKLAVSLADSIRFSLARQDETEEAMHECSELRILVDGLLEMNQKLSDERNLWMKEAERWKGTNK